MPERNWLGQLHYYADRASRRFLGVPFAPIEHRILGPFAFEWLKFLEIHGYAPHLRTPRTFSEKICHRKFYDHNPLFSLVADKWAVREYVAQRVGSEVLNEVFCVVADFDSIPIDTLPDQFVIRATHGSGMNLIVADKSKLDVAEARRRCSEFLSRRYGSWQNEFHYGPVPRRLIVERFLRTNGHSLIDHRFHVFHGRCEFIQIDEGGVPPTGRHFYSRDWQPLDYTTLVPMAPVRARPGKLEQMIDIAERLSRDFDYMRVDLYLLDDERIVFGEMTVTPGAGRRRFGPTRDVDFQLGRYW